jgi:SEC-C motif domain protein
LWWWQAHYIVDTTHPQNPSWSGSKTPDGEFSSSLLEDVYATCRTVGWERLKILEREDGEDESFVTFQAWFKFIGQQGQRQKGTKLETLKERSRFVREDGKWLYISGSTDYKFHRYE